METPDPRDIFTTPKKVPKYPCDGVARFRVKGVRSAPLPYSQAWDSIFRTTGCYKKPDEFTGKDVCVLTDYGIKCLFHLNYLYLAAASSFVEQSLREQNRFLEFMTHTARRVFLKSQEERCRSLNEELKTLIGQKLSGPVSEDLENRLAEVSAQIKECPWVESEFGMVLLKEEDSRIFNNEREALAREAYFLKATIEVDTLALDANCLTKEGEGILRANKVRLNALKMRLDSIQPQEIKFSSGVALPLAVQNSPAEGVGE